MIEALLGANPQTVVVLMDSNPVLMPWIDSATAVLEIWNQGTEDGHVVADLMFGRVNASGKVPTTYPRSAYTTFELPDVTGIARQMVGRWGMSDAVGPVQIYPSDADARSAGFSEEMLAHADAEVRKIVEECYAQAKTQLQENRSRLDSIVGALLERETLGEAEVYAAAGIDRASAPSPQDTMPGAHGEAH